jgi:hypothetical protein
VACIVVVVIVVDYEERAFVMGEKKGQLVCGAALKTEMAKVQ